MKTKMTLSFAKKLRALLAGELNYAEFSSSNRELLDQFIADYILNYRLIGKQQRKIFCPDANELTLYLQSKFEIPSLEGYIDFYEQEDVSRRDSVLAGSDSKLRKVKVFTGFLLNCHEEILGELHAQPFLIKPVRGAFTFVSAHQVFKIPPDVTVIIVEGHENFRDIHRQKYLFEGLRPLFLWRYQNSNTIAEWLNSIPNPYIHFGDFDLKGIHIYLSELRNKISGDRGKFLIPDDLEMLLSAYGEKDLYEKQKVFLPAIQAQCPEALVPVIELILKYKKGLAQEILIR
jgi:hypothetical protein